MNLWKVVTRYGDVISTIFYRDSSEILGECTPTISTPNWVWDDPHTLWLDSMPGPLHWRVL